MEETSEAVIDEDDTAYQRWVAANPRRHPPYAVNRRGLCADCGVDTYAIDEYYMVRHDVWQAAGGHRCSPRCADWPDHSVMLCIGCLEQRLGRELCATDFLGAPCNQGARSVRMRARMESPGAGERLD